MLSYFSDRGFARSLAAVVAIGLWGAAPAPRAGAQAPATVILPAERELESAAARVREGRIDEAQRLIKEQAAKHPEWPPAQLILARLFFNANQPMPGRRALEQAATEVPDHPEIYLTMGSLALGEGRLSDARLNFEKARETTQSGKFSAEKKGSLHREVLAGLATVAEAREDWKTGQRYLSEWLELDPKNGQVRQRLGRALFRLGRTDDAYAALTQAVRDAPALDPAPVWMALLYSQQGDFKHAEEWFEKAKKAEPKSAMVRRAHAAWLLDRGRAADARTEIDAAVKLDPELKEAQRMQGLVAWYVRDLPAAQEIFDRLHRDMPADVVVANLLAQTLVDQTDAAKRSRGLQLAEVNAAQFPRSPEVLATLGWALYRAGRLDEAEQKLRASITGGRTTPDVAYYLARVLAEKEQTDSARQLLQTIAGVQGPFAHREDATSLLKTLKK